MTSFYIHDIRHFLSHLTVRKTVNILKLWVSYHITKWLKRPVPWGLPMTISIEPTTACNLRCPECPSGLRSFTRKTGHLKTDFFRKVMDELSEYLTYLIFYFQGEPYINPDFLKMVEYASSKGIYTITSTNGHFLNMDNARKTVASGLSRIIISVDGTTQDVYAQYRKSGQLDTVLQGARNLVRARKEAGSRTPHIIFQFLVVRPNEHQIPEVYRLASDIGIDEVKLKTAQVYNYTHGNDLIPQNDRYSRYVQKEDGTWKVKNKLLNHCWKMWHACVVTWDGMVVPCCFDKDATHRLGDLKQASFKSVWLSPEYTQFRKQLLRGRNTIDICTNCTEGCSVWAST
jgi:radical SAM protein with 4Fe4S-binding SPASM domain